MTMTPRSKRTGSKRETACMRSGISWVRGGATYGCYTLIVVASDEDAPGQASRRPAAVSTDRLWMPYPMAFIRPAADE
jgi:hypothetical protein